MSTATANAPTTISDYTRQIVEADPKTALEIALAATETARLETERAKTEAREMAEVTMGPDGFAATNLGGVYRLGQMYASSSLVPDVYQGKPADCAIVVQLAQRWGIDPFMAFQHVYMVHGKPGVDGQLAVALLNQSGKIIGTVRYQFDGDGDEYGCTAIVTDKTTGSDVAGPKVDWQMVKKEGWFGKKGSKWQTMPNPMFHYRAASFLIRTRYPEVLMGMQTTDELEDVGPKTQPADALPAPETLDDIADRLTQPAQQHAEPTGNGNGNAKAAEEQPEATEPASWTEDELHKLDECELALGAVNLDGTAEEKENQYTTLDDIYKAMNGDGTISDTLFARVSELIADRRAKVLKPKRGKKATT